LTYQGLDEIKEKVIEEAKAVLNAIITCGYPNDAEKSLELSKRYHSFVFLTLGLHPVDIVKMSDQQVKEYLDLIRNNRENIVAVGEIGLDKHIFKDEKQNERFREVFLQCLELAKELDLPAVLHLRKAEQEGFDIVSEMGIKKVVFHYYSGGITLARQIIERGYYISIPSTINNSKNLRDIGKKFPLEFLLTETDSPFSSPFNEKINVPQNVKVVVEKIAELRKIDAKEVDRITTENAIKIFGLPIKIF
jgi:TatD DNase family protein